MTGPTTELRRAMKALFIPHIVDLGFTIDERHQPFSTTFRRRSGDNVQILDVQWDKYGRPRFAVRFGTCPAEGLRARGELYPAADTLATWCVDAGSLCPHRWGMAREWFRQDATWAERLTGRPALRDPSRVVTKLLALFPQIERYWATGEVSTNLKIWNLSASEERHGAPGG